MKNLRKYIYTLCLLAMCTSCHKSNPAPQWTEKQLGSSGIIHKAHLKDGWYTQSKAALEKDMSDYFEQAQTMFPCSVNQESVRILIVPHAGHQFSGLCAATAYQTLLNNDTSLPLEQRKNTLIKRVIILSPSHTQFFNNIALPDYSVYQMAMGDVPVDTSAITILKKSNLFRDYPAAHSLEHAIEIQLPFLQATIADFSIVPLVVGHFKDTTDIDEICQRLERIIDNQTLIVVSSDFTHFGPTYEYMPFTKSIIAHVRSLDSMAIGTIMQQSYYLFSSFLTETSDTICGRDAIKLLLALLGRKSLKQDVNAYLTGYYTSAQIQAARQKNNFVPQKLFSYLDDTEALNSVSYVGLVFATDPIASYAPDQRLTGYEKQSLLTLARATIENNFVPSPQQLAPHLLYPIVTPALQQSVGAFVTLTTKQGQLRGCIGRITSNDPLYKTVQEMAQAAAFQDSRFKPLTIEELANITLDITVLTQPQKIASYNDIILGKHGIILHKNDIQGREIASALFLPQVPREQQWDLETTLEELCHKAGLAYDAWKENCTFEVFEGFEIKETDRQIM